MAVKERIYQYLEYKGITPTAAERALGWSVGALTKAKSVTADRAEEFLLFYKDASAEWLLRGDGIMCGDVCGNETRPRIPYDAAAGSLTDAVEGVTEVQCERMPVVAAFPKYDFTLRVTGQSMEPVHCSGDEVACLRVIESRFLQWGRVYVLDTTQGIVIKRKYDNGDSIRCVSYNPEYPDFNIPKEDIRSYNLVVGALRLS